MSSYGREPAFPGTHVRQWDQGARKRPLAVLPAAAEQVAAEAVPLLTNPRAQRTLAAVVEEHVRATLILVGGNRSAAAEALGIDRRTLYRKLSSYGLHAKRKTK